MHRSSVLAAPAVLTAIGFVVCLSGQAAADLTVYTDKSLYDSAISTTHLVNFDTDTAGSPIASGTTITDQYKPWGLTFRPFNGGAPMALSDDAIDTDGLLALSSPNRIRAVPNTGQGGGGFEVLLDQPVQGAGLYLGDVEFSGSEIEAFDGSGKSLGVVDVFANVGSSPFAWKFLGLSSEAGIAKLDVSFPLDDYITADDLQVGPASSVPEPSILTVLAGLSVTGIALLRKRRKQTDLPDRKAPSTV